MNQRFEGKSERLHKMNEYQFNQYAHFSRQVGKTPAEDGNSWTTRCFSTARYQRQ